MLMRLSGAICVAAAIFAFSSSSSSMIKAGGIARGAAISRSLLRAAKERAAEGRVEKPPQVIKAAISVSPTTEVSATGIGAVIARALSAGSAETASGERYDPSAWTAAIQTDLRDMFGGVRFGKDYRPVFALVAADDKQAIIKINDVGPLAPGRIIDLNEHTMRYFDPTFERGLISHVTVTPLRGDGWLTGPLPQSGSSAS